MQSAHDLNPLTQPCLYVHPEDPLKWKLNYIELSSDVLGNLMTTLYYMKIISEWIDLRIALKNYNSKAELI